MTHYLKLSAIVGVAFAALMGGAQAQVAITSQSNSTAGAAAVLNQTNVLPAPIAGNPTSSGVGTIYNHQSGTVWNMGQTTGGNAITSYDACLKYLNLTGLFVNVGVPLEISHCWALRDMDAMAKFPPGSLQYEHGCADSAWAKTDWDTGTMACTINKTRLRRNDPNDPRAATTRYVPVVQAGHGANTQAMMVPPTVVPVTPTNAPVGPLPAVSPEVCMDRSGRVVPKGTAGASCGQM